MNDAHYINQWIRVWCVMTFLLNCVSYQLFAQADQATSDKHEPRISTQQAQVGIHYLEFTKHKHTSVNDSSSALPFTSEKFSPKQHLMAGQEVLSKNSTKIFGYYPYWTPQSYLTTRPDTVLTHIGYFSADADSTGTVTIQRPANIPLLRTYCTTYKLKLILVATIFGADNNTAVLGDIQKTQRVISQLMSAVRNYGFDGIDIDAETVPREQRNNLVRFTRLLRDSLSEFNQSMELSMATPAVDWSNSFDLKSLDAICNNMMIMGYDYYYSGSPTAGPTAPLKGENYNVIRSVQTYLDSGVSASKLMLGVPWYGYEWAVIDTNRKSQRDTKRGLGKAYLYQSISRRGQQFNKYDLTTESVWYILRDSTGYFQGWFDDSISLAMKYKLITTRKLAGVGIWALGYEGSDGFLRSGLKQAFISNSTTSFIESDNSYSQQNTDELTNQKSVFPQPAVESVTLSIPAQTTVRIVSVIGEHINSWYEEYSVVKQVDIRHLPNGLYLIEYSSSSNNRFFPLCVSR
jgi:spore germination protein YaaH